MNYRVTLAAVLVTALVALSFTWDSGSQQDNEHLKIVMRSVGHEILQSAGDRHSRVLPIEYKEEGSWVIRFENSLLIWPDSLVAIARRVMEKQGIHDYRLSVLSCTNAEMVYGFEVSKSQRLTPCTGRSLPEGCYAIKMTLLPPDDDHRLATFVTLSLGIVGLIGIARVGRKPEHRENVQKTEPVLEGVKIGNFRFIPARRTLVFGEDAMSLSHREAQVLEMLTSQVNKIVSREELMKLWENDGVFVGRSLDVFISRLRKRLIQDATVRIVNVHARGYKLEVD